MLNILCNYIYLDVHERRKLLATKTIEYLIEQFQEPAICSVDAQAAQQSINVPFFLNHSVKELIWCYQSLTAKNNNDTGNYANILNYNTVNEALVEPFTMIELKYNGNDRFPQLPAKYFRTVQIYEHHTSSTLDNYIYVFSFAIFPEKNQPSGTCNFSKIDDVRMNITLTTNILAGNIHILAINYNILKFQSGMAGILFNS